MNDIGEPQLRLRRLLNDYPEPEGGQNDTVEREDIQHTVGLHDHNVTNHRFREKLHDAKRDFMGKLEIHVDTIIDELGREIDATCSGPPVQAANGTRPGSLPTDQHAKKRPSKNKEFIAQRSVLTELLEVTHFETIHNIFVAVLIIFAINQVANDIKSHGNPWMHADFIHEQLLSKIPVVICLWLAMHAIVVIGTYFCFHYWANTRDSFENKEVIDYIALAFYIFFIGVLLCVPTYYVIYYDLPGASSSVIILEQLRLMMKTYSFIRENAPRAMGMPCVLTQESTTPTGDKINSSRTLCPDFSKFLYFMFAPTLIYRDSYPRTPYIRWRYVVTNIMQCLGCIIYTNFIFARYCLPVFRSFGSGRGIEFFVRALFNSMIPATCAFMLLFFAVLHSWLNAFAEICCFADRMFYNAWWNSTSFSGFFRNWNVVVHDWLYNYIYLDMMSVTRGNRAWSYTMVFAISSIFHEYVMIIILRVFYPIMLFLFGGVGFLFMLIFKPKQQRLANIIFWCFIFSGNGVILCLYSMEVYASINCVSQYNFPMAFLLPKMWSCYSYTIEPLSNTSAIQ